jgi:hypothetical protein
MLEPGDGPRLALEPNHELLVARVAGIHHLDGDRPIETDVETAVHRGHASGRDRGVHPVPTVQHGTDERVRTLAGLHACILDSVP